MERLTGWRRIGHRVVIALIVLWTVVPVYWLVVMSVTPQVHLAGTRTPTMVPRDVSFTAYETLLNPDAQTTSRFSPAAFFRRALLNSTLISLIATLIALSIGTLAAYSLVRLHVPGSNALFFLILASYMIAPITLAIPLYSAFRTLGWLDTYQALIAVYVAGGVGWATMIMRNHFQMIPQEIEDSARIDGCSRLRVLVAIILPISVPGLVSVGLVIFLLSWGEFLFALLFTQSEAARTLPVVVTMFVGEFGVDYPTMAAALLISVLPPAAAALVFSKYIVSGLTAGAVKG